MYIQKISNKASVFLNHKHFHPGNSKNREKVWLAEQKQKEEERKQEELLKKRKKEWEIEELKKDLKFLNRKNDSVTENFPQYETNEQLKNVFSEKKNKTFIQSSIYKEDILIGNHSFIWGSYYDIKEHKWGYRCCKSIIRNSSCSFYNKVNKNKKIKNKLYLDNEEKDCLADILKSEDVNKKSSGFIGKFYKKKQGISDLLTILKNSKNEN